MNKILIIQTAFIGDVILATAVVEKWKKFHPNHEIHFLLRKGNERLLDNNPHIDKLIIWNKKENKWRSYFSIVKEIRRTEYSFVINIHRFFSSGFLTAFSKGKITVGFNKNPLSLLYSHKVKHEIGTEKNPVHEVERNLKLIQEFTDDTFIKPKLYPAEEDYRDTGQTGQYITISPGSVWHTKQWPQEKWMDFISRVGDGLKIYLLGGKNEIDLCRNIHSKSAHKNIEIKAGKLTFLQSAAFMKNARMNYVNDSAPLHLASAVNAPVTAIFCSTVPEFGFTPLSSDSAVLETSHPLSCRPCGLHGKNACPKNHFKCAEIDVERLLERLK